MNKESFDYYWKVALLVILLLGLGLMAWGYANQIPQGQKCLDNPLGYAENTLNKGLNAGTPTWKCDCSNPGVHKFPQIPK
jgi:hypothetical protein